MAEPLKRQADKSGDEGNNSPPKKSSKRPIEHLIEEVEKQGLLLAIQKSLTNLCESRHAALIAVEIKQCNGGVGYGISFSHATCVTEESIDEFYPFASVFRKGMKFLEDILHNDHIPEDDIIIQPVERLLHFISQKDSENFIVGLLKKDLHRYERRLSVALAEHLFSKLASPNYILDNHCPLPDYICMCGCKKNFSSKAGNTSIGNEVTWHGYLDILVGVDGVPIAVESGESSPGGKTPVEVEYQNDRLDCLLIQQQIIAQTIVFSFYQRQRHPDAEHFLIPAVGISCQQIMFFFYDSEKDILLRSKPLSLKIGKKMNYDAVVALWFVLNYKTLGSGVSASKPVPKARFFENAKDSLEIYQQNLTFGDVNRSKEPLSVDPTECLDANFEKEHFKFFKPNK